MHLLVPSATKNVKVGFLGQSQSLTGQSQSLTGQGQSQNSHEDQFQSRRQDWKVPPTSEHGRLSYFLS
jgi:hypothetical protein